ncbi:MAG TPA: class I SAM-dependent methyltransferase [Candidatus Bathyarchaeia archaeon]|nr:class I SAM-dependent methyltransferase [Candidatus Bathyarchaeia archaeon]
MDEAVLIAAWSSEESQPFSGWDFGHIRGRYSEEKPPWSYEDLAREALRGAECALDLGTGGGEVLARLSDAFPRRMVATEAYPPNWSIARERLAPTGASVVAYAADETSSPLPFRDGSFAVVLDRHEAYDAHEVARVLTPGGVFLTQQVNGRSHADLLGWFGTEPHWPDVTLDRLAADLVQAGLNIELARSWWGSISFLDVAALVYYLKAIPWEVPDFSVGRFKTELFGLQRRLDETGALRFDEGLFAIRARKPR